MSDNDDIRLEYIKRYKEEEVYLIYYGDNKLRAKIIVSHIARNITFDNFLLVAIDWRAIIYDIFELAEEYIIPEYKGYEVWRNNILGNKMYWEWKETRIK